MEEGGLEDGNWEEDIEADDGDPAIEVVAFDIFEGLFILREGPDEEDDDPEREHGHGDFE